MTIERLLLILQNIKESQNLMKLIGIDTGGTFTDFVYYHNGRLQVHKVLSSPDAPDKAILQGLAELNVSFEDLQIIHGSTVATNAVLEGKGVKTVYITNRGLKDVLLIGRQARDELYNLRATPRQRLIDANLCLETGGRLSASGEVIEKLSEADLQQLLQEIERLAPQSVAINLLFSFLDDRAEKRIEAALPTSLFVCRSSAILPEYKEYERGMATWLNAYIGPLVKNYLDNLHQAVKPAKLSVMLSTGGTASAEQAGNKAVNMLLSGPAGGLQAAKHIAAQLAEPNLLTFDMGGTSTDVALIEGQINLTNEAKINGLPVAVAMVDMHTIGAGGGSIASVDAGGLLQVGPQSAGANPGPVCYDNGGSQVTVTDANLLLGLLPVKSCLSGNLRLDKSSAERSMQALAQQLNCPMLDAAAGIIKLANEHMAQALRVISVQKGFDPRGFSLLSFGGAGGLHVCDLAEIMAMRKAVVPLHAGVLSAFGMLVAPVSRELSLTLMLALDSSSEPLILQGFNKLKQQGLQEMLGEGINVKQAELSLSVDARYVGQSFTLNVPWDSIACCQQQFHATHRNRYGHKIEQAIELVNLRVSIKSPSRSLNWEKLSIKSPARPIYFTKVSSYVAELPVYQRQDLAVAQEIVGPAIIVENVATTFIKHNWRCKVHSIGHLLLTYCDDTQTI